jgi:hypothetical protein
MKDLSWTKVPLGTPDEGPDTKGFFDVARYAVNVNHGNYTQWTEVEILLDMAHKPPLFWRKVTVGTSVVWAVAKAPIPRRLMNRCPDHPNAPLVDRKDGDIGCATCGKTVSIETVRE